MSNIKIEKNVLPKEDLKIIQNTLIDPKFPWYYSPRQVPEVVDESNNLLIKEASVDYEDYFAHSFYSRTVQGSPSFNIILKLINHIKPVAIIEARANFNINKNKVWYSGWHCDFHENKKLNHNTSLFYVNTNNGYTEFKTGEKIMSEENTLITFKADNLHRACNQTDTPYRIVINLNYFN